jgi:hypothetical protein
MPANRKGFLKKLMAGLCGRLNHHSIYPPTADAHGSVLVNAMLARSVDAVKVTTGVVNEPRL